MMRVVRPLLFEHDESLGCDARAARLATGRRWRRIISRRGAWLKRLDLGDLGALLVGEPPRCRYSAVSPNLDGSQMRFPRALKPAEPKRDRGFRNTHAVSAVLLPKSVLSKKCFQRDRAARHHVLNQCHMFILN